MEREQVILISTSTCAPALASDSYCPFLPKYASSLENAKLLLNNPLHDVRAMFISCEPGDSDFVKMIRLGITSCPGMPLYLIDKNNLLEKLGINNESRIRMGITGVFNEDLDFSQMTQALDPLLQDYQPETVEDSSSLIKNSAEYIPLNAQHFLSSSKSLFDVYVKLGGDKFVKISQAGQKVEVKRITNYLKKGVKTFYLSKNAQKSYIHYCDYVATKIRLSHSLPESLKISQSLHLGDQIAGLLESEVFNAEQLNMAAGFVESVNDLVSRIAPKGSLAFNTFLEDIKSYSHGVATTMLATVVAKEFDLEDLTITERVGLAAMFHDLGMKLLPETLREKNVNEMSIDELSLYHSHPQLGASELEETPYVHESVINAVRHHHVRKDSSGFPKEIPFSEASLIAQIVGASDEIVHALEVYKNSNSDLQKYFEENIANRFSNHLIKAIRQIFFESKNI